jgi:hypothetical protein
MDEKGVRLEGQSTGSDQMANHINSQLELFGQASWQTKLS